VAVGEFVAVGVDVMVADGVLLGINVLVGAEPDPVTLTSSIYQPSFDPPLSVANLKRSMA
jgi:hypothetical protein